MVHLSAGCVFYEASNWGGGLAMYAALISWQEWWNTKVIKTES